MKMNKGLALVSAGILVGMSLAFPTAHAAEKLLTAVRSSHQFFLDGAQIEMEAYVINGNNYVKLADVGRMVGFNVYWDGATGTVQINGDDPYTGQPPQTAPDLNQVREEVIKQVNQVRLQYGVSFLTVDDALMAAAQDCAERCYTWHHNREECEAVASHGYPYGFGNNLTVFTGCTVDQIAEQAVENWMNSPGHLRTMIDPEGAGVGVGVHNENGVTYCYLFIGKPGTLNPYGA